MNIAVFDVPASDSGALAILRDFCAALASRKEDGNNWYVVVTTGVLDQYSGVNGITIVKLPAQTKKWSRRAVFELAGAGKFVREHAIDVIFSLQNMVVWGTRIPQVLYVHMSLPYMPGRFRYANPHERFLAFYTDLYRVLIGASVRRAGAVIVQTGWLKDAIAERHSVDPGNITVIPPAFELGIAKGRVDRESSTFFYPATPFVYKNIDCIIDAAAILKGQGEDFTIRLTIDGSENKYSKYLLGRIRKLGLGECFELIGRQKREFVFEQYGKATLLFPSRVESYGLPLLEARFSEAPIIASDLPFAREILDGYGRCRFADPLDPRTWAEAMCESLRGDLSQAFAEGEPYRQDSGGWEGIIDIIYSMSMKTCGK